jgi:hypothetical protein
LAHAAAEELLTWLGFTDVDRAQDETVTQSTPDSAAGYILTRSADLYGRCITLIGRDPAPRASGSPLFVDVDVLRTTANHHLISQGLAYPTYYRNLFSDPRNELTAAVQHASQRGPGVWPEDKTTAGFQVTGLEVIEDDVVIVPKLFRRLVDYLHLGDSSMAAFRHSWPGCRSVLHSVHGTLDDRAGCDRGSRRGECQDDRPDLRSRLRREVMVFTWW